MYTKSSLIALISLLPYAYAQNAVADLVGKLRLAPTQVDRIGLLKDQDLVFNFLQTGVGESNGAGGRTVAATASNFPGLIENGVAMTLGFLGPCGINTPHTHPRATEINFAVNGTLRTGMLAENGARFVFNDLPAGHATVFPKGVIHFEMNDNCQPTTFVAAFNHEDPGVLAVAQRFFGLPPDIVGATLGDIGVQEIAGLESKIPNNIAQGTDACLKRCGIQRVTQPTTQRQPRVAGNALPSGSGSGTPPPAPAPPAPAPPAPAPPPPAHAAAQPPPPPAAAPNSGAVAPSFQPQAASGRLGDGGAKGFAALGDDNGSNGSNPNLPFMIALLVINGLFVVGALVGVFFYVKSTRNSGHRRSMSGLREMKMGGGYRDSQPQFTPLRDQEKETEYYDPYHGRAASPAPIFQAPKDV